MKKLFTCLMLMVGMLLPLTATAADLKADLTMYYDVSTFGDFSGKKLQVMIGHGTYSTTYAMKAVEGYDNLYSVNIGEVNSGNAWGGATQLGFMAADAIWGGEANGSSSQPKERIKWAPMYSGIYNISSTLSGNVLFTGKDALSITKDYKLPAKAPEINIASVPDFVTTTVGETSSITVTYGLENATEATATIEGEGFSISEQAVGTVTVVFAPEAEGEYTGTLTITSGEVTAVANLTAKAVAAETPKEPEILNVSDPTFEEIIEGESTSVTVTYDIANEGDLVPEATIEGEGFSILEQETGSVVIEFTAETAGEYVGLLTITLGEVEYEVNLAATVEKAPAIITISFVNPDWTEAAIWAWIDGGENLTGGEWPGKAMTKGENGKFTYDLTIPDDGVYNFIINNNNNGLQSVNMTGVTESTCYNLGAKSGEKYNLVVAENCDYTPAPEPEPIDPYVAIRGSMTEWDTNEITMTYNAEAEYGPEWYITAFEIPEAGEFKVVSVNENSEVTWYGSDKVDLQEGITNSGEGEGNIIIPAGKYDVYFKVNEGRIWIQKYVAPEEPTPSITVSDDEVIFDEITLGEEPVSATETIIYEIKNSDEAAVITLESEVFSAEDVDGTITITFAPTAAGEYTAELIIAAGEISETVTISGSAAVASEEPEPSITVSATEVIFEELELGEEPVSATETIIYEIKNSDEAAVITLESEVFSAEDVDGTITITFAPTAAGEYTAELIISVGEISETIAISGSAAVASEEPDPEPDNTITFTVLVPEGTKECYIAGTSDDKDLEWTFIQMEKVDGEENLFSITVEKTVLNGQEWKYASGAEWQYSEVIEGNGNRTEPEDPYDVVTAWQKLYDPDFQPIDPYYAIRGLNGDASWTGSGDIKLEESADGSEWSALGFTVAEGESFKVIYIDENAKIAGYYAGLETGVDLGQSYDDNGNLVLPAGTYNLYFKPDTELMWISKVDTPTDAEEAIAEIIYAVDGTIIAPAPFAIIDLSGKDVTNANGSLQGTYIVKTQNSVAKISVK